MSLNSAIAPSLLRNGWWEFSARLLSQRPQVIPRSQKGTHDELADIEGMLRRYHALKDRRREIERDMGGSLEWRELTQSKRCVIGTALHDANHFDRDTWSYQHTWLADALESFEMVLAPLIRENPSL